MAIIGRERVFVQKATFDVELDGVPIGGFTKCEPFTTEYSLIEQKEGGSPTDVDKTPSTFKFPNLTLERPLELDRDELVAWDEAQQAGDRTKRNMSVIAQDPDGTPLYRWNLTGCALVKYEGAAFDRGAETENVMEKAEISYTGRKRVRG